MVLWNRSMTADPDPWTREAASRIYWRVRAAWGWLWIGICVAVLLMYGLDRVMHLIIPERVRPDLK